MILPVIMAGGSGSRLWPLSRELYPKQFLTLIGQQSMLQQTIGRLNGIEHADPILICNEEHRFVAAEQVRLSGHKHDGIILEPVGRNTAPAITLAALHAIKNAAQDEDPILLVLAADHIIENNDAFHSAIKNALPFAEQGKLVTFGIVPTTPETGYGYINAGNEINNGFVVNEFVEKPDLETAQKYLESEAFYWNSGMFLFKASQYIEALAQFTPSILKICEQAMANAESDLEFIRVDKELFTTCPDDSIDYAIMEPLTEKENKKVVVIPLDAGWSDVGSWSALWDVSEKDAQNNANHGDVIHIGTTNSYAYAENKLIATVGVDNLIIVETKDAILVANKEQVQDVKAVVNQLKSDGRSEHKLHREVYRPWGKYDSIDSGKRDQVKRITVKPGEKLSIQKHHHRSEHWVVVSGTASVLNGEETILVSENQSTYIPVGTIHALENPGKIPLEMIEVQSGSYLGEDDIIRFSDKYGRI